MVGSHHHNRRGTCYNLNPTDSSGELHDGLHTAESSVSVHRVGGRAGRAPGIRPRVHRETGMSNTLWMNRAVEILSLKTDKNVHRSVSEKSYVYQCLLYNWMVHHSAVELRLLKKSCGDLYLLPKSAARNEPAVSGQIDKPQVQTWWQVPSQRTRVAHDPTSDCKISQWAVSAQ